MFDPLDRATEEQVQSAVAKFLNGQTNVYTLLRTINEISGATGIAPTELIQAANEADAISAENPMLVRNRAKTVMLCALARDAQYGLAGYSWLRALSIRNVMPETYANIKAGLDYVV